MECFSYANCWKGYPLHKGNKLDVIIYEKAKAKTVLLNSIALLDNGMGGKPFLINSRQNIT